MNYKEHYEETKKIKETLMFNTQAIEFILDSLYLIIKNLPASSSRRNWLDKYSKVSDLFYNWNKLDEKETNEEK